MHRFWTFALVAVFAGAWGGAAASADPAGEQVTAPATTGSPAAVEGSKSSIASALGDPTGLRAFLDARGIDFTFTYIGEVLGNTTGGVKRGASLEGQLDGQIDIDLAKLVGLDGAVLHANFYQNHGRSLSGNNLLDLLSVSTLEAYPSTKLYEAWLEKSFFSGDVAVRVGQLGADTEFFTSEAATVFFNPTFGAPALLANDLPSGGPTYPLAAPAARLLLKPTPDAALRVAVFDGDPAGPYRPEINNPNPQIRDLTGTNFRLGDPPLLITELALATPHNASPAVLPGTVKIGYVHHFGLFAATGTSGSPSVSYRGDDAYYAMVDQAIYRSPGAEDAGASVFLRAFGAPSDRNLIDLYVDGGIAFKGLIPGRSGDTAGASFAYARVSSDVARVDAQRGGPLVRDYQANIEVTYQYLVRPGFSVQPEFQYVVHPGAHGVADPRNGQPIRNAAVFGLRATVQY